MHVFDPIEVFDLAYNSNSKAYVRINIFTLPDGRCLQICTKYMFISYNT
jgi:hypothetical protein